MATDDMLKMDGLHVREQEKGSLSPNGVGSIDTGMAAQSLSTCVCPHCGAPNDPESLFCEICGARLRDMCCPKCGAVIDEGCDFCENCHSYVSTDRCPFCYGLVGEDDTFCPDCGAPLSGIECPVCHTLGRFAFCASCGTPLTDRAREDAKEVWESMPDAAQLHQLEDELEQLWMVRPVMTDRQREEIKSVKALCDRVKELLAQEGESTYADVSRDASEPVILSEQELSRQILDKQQALQALLDSMEMKSAENPAVARNYAMARKPRISRLAWKCNYKHALHKSPLGCACPQQGGKWVVIDGKTEVLDD